MPIWRSQGELTSRQCWAAAPRTRERGFGGVDGRAIRAGDRIPLGSRSSGSAVACNPCPIVSGGARLRVLSGTAGRFLSAGGLRCPSFHAFHDLPLNPIAWGTVLLSPKAIPRIADREMISDATFTGAIQVPPSGQPILLMADRQTTGGYPQIAVVITADLPLAGQLVPASGSSSKSVPGPTPSRRSQRRSKGCATLADATVIPQAQVPLAPFTTLGVGGPARWFLKAGHVDDVRGAHVWSRERALPLFVLGGGSNLVISDEGFSGLIVQVALEGTEVSRDGRDTVVRGGRRRVVGRSRRGDGRSRSRRRGVPLWYSRHHRRHADSECGCVRPGDCRHDRERDRVRCGRPRNCWRCSQIECRFCYRHESIQAGGRGNGSSCATSRSG